MKKGNTSGNRSTPIKVPDHVHIRLDKGR